MSTTTTPDDGSSNQHGHHHYDHHSSSDDDDDDDDDDNHGRRRLPNPTIHPDHFLHVPAWPRPSPRSSTSTYIVFFIPGNPGLISYYHTFLSLLSDRLDTSSAGSSLRCVTAALSLGGFEVAGAGSDRRRRTGRTEGGGGGGGGGGDFLYRLDEQVDLAIARIEELVCRVAGDGDDDGGGGGGVVEKGDARSCKVILVGHSVGAYIALEVLRRRRRGDRFPKQGGRGGGGGGGGGVGGGGKVGVNYDIVAAVLLTPTVVDIAISASGKVLAPLLRYVPAFPLLISLAARLIVALLPGSWLRMLVRLVMGLDTPTAGVETTVSFLRSPNGVRQSLAMAADEMREIGPDRWGDEVWGGAAAGAAAARDGVRAVGGRAPLVFYFARRDHWLADRTRDAIIGTRGAVSRMIVAEDEGDLVHGWCIRQSGPVAERVQGWVWEMIETDQRAHERRS